jgi:hypothetical protein
MKSSSVFKYENNLDVFSKIAINSYLLFLCFFNFLLIKN